MPADQQQPETGYVEHITDFTNALMRTGRRWRQWFVMARMTAITCSAAVPVTAATTAPRWVLALLGATTVIAEGAISISRFDQRGLIATAVARDMLSELRRYRAKAAPYQDPDATAVLADRLEDMHHDAFSSMSELRMGTSRKLTPRMNDEPAG